MKKAKAAPAPPASASTTHEDKAPAPELSTVPSLHKYTTKLSNVIARYGAISEKIKALEDQKRELGKQALPILFRANVQRVIVDGYPVAVVKATRAVLSKIRLIENGVDPEIIDKSTEHVEQAPYLRVDKRRTGEVD